MLGRFLMCLFVSWLVVCALAASSPPTWTPSPLIKTGVFTAITSNTAGADRVTVSYPSPYTTVPKLAFGANLVQTNTSTFTQVIWDVQVDASPTTSGFKVKMVVNTTMKIALLQINYITIDSTDNSISTRYNAPLQAIASCNQLCYLVTPINSGSGYRSLTANAAYARASGDPPIILNHTNKLLILIQGISMMRNNGPYFNVTVNAVFISTTTYTITISTSHNCTISLFHFSRIIIDQTAVQANLDTFIDADRLYSTATNWTALSLSLVWSTPLNYMLALTSITIGSADIVDFNFTTQSCTGRSNFTAISFSYFNYRFRACPSGFPYFNLADNLCYDLCPGGSVPNTTIGACVVCSYQCLTCSATTTCLTCNASLFRVLLGTTCICLTGYYDTGVAACSPCNYTCLSCANSTNCTSCSTTNFRTINSTGQCPCSTGYVDTGVSLCTACSTLINGCASCSSPTVCTACSGGYLLSAGSCICSAGTYASGSTCSLCSATMLGCTACTSATVCTVCNSTAFFQLSGSSCVCQFGYYASGSTCLSCSAAMVGCVSCTNSTNCLACDASLNLVFNSTSMNCVCNTGYYMSGTVCVSCSTALVNCNACSSATVCTNCTAPSVLTSGVCGCGPGTYNDGFGNCIACTITLPGCTLCTSSTVCTACNTANNYLLTGTTCGCANGFILNGGLCVIGCPSTNQYFNGSLCLNCDPTCATCLGGSSLNCTSCTSPNVLSAGQCLCPSGQYMDATATCQPCSALCLTCVSSSTNCQSCAAPLVINGSTCVCSAGLYLPTGSTFCMPCDPSCALCNGSSNSDCIGCAPTFVQTGTTCACAAQQYVDPVTNNCKACHYSCLTCNGTTATDCLTCSAANSRTLSGTGCLCNSGMFDIGNPACYASNCQVGYSPDASGTCQEICGDGRLYVLPCDDGNTVSGDGCSSTCSIEANYTCQGGSTTTASICSYNQPITLTLLSTTKNLTDNIVYFDIQISPPISALNGLNFSSVLTSNLTGANLTFVYNSLTGRLMVAAQYTSSIQSQNVSLLFTPSASSASPYFFATPASSYSFVVSPQNNLAADEWDADTYARVKFFEVLWQILLYLSLAGFLISLVTAKFIGIEMVGVVQIAFLGLMVIDNLQPLIAPMTKIFTINGINTAFADSTLNKTLPYRASSLHYGASFTYNLNYSLVLLLLPLLVALFVFISSKIRRDIEDKLKRISMDILCEYGFTAVLFLFYQIATSLGLFIVYDTPATSTLYGASIAQVIVVLGEVVTILVLFNFFPQNFGQYRTAFQEDLASQNHYYLLVGYRFILATILSIGNDSARIGYICLIPSLMALGYLAAKRPYRHLYNNIRAICNEVVVVSSLLIYAYYRSAVAHQQHLTTTNAALPYVLAALLFGCVIGNMALMIKWKYDSIRERKIQETVDTREKVAKMQDEEKDLFLEEAKRKLTVLRQDGRHDSISSKRIIEPSCSKQQLVNEGPQYPQQRVRVQAEEEASPTEKELLEPRRRPELKEKLLRTRLTTETKVFMAEQHQAIEERFHAL